MKKLVVIGSNAFSGASFIQYALQKEIDVIGISRSLELNQAFLPYRWQNSSHFQFYQYDLNKDLEKILSLIHDVRPDYIVNFAAQSMVAQSWDHPEDWMMTNVVSTIKLHDALRQLDFLERYVHISTPEVYGSCEGYVKEDQIFNPSTPYAVSRAASDMSLRTFYKAYQFPVVTTRAANVYGPGQQLYRIIPRTILYIKLGKKIELHGGGLSTRSFIHINDVSDATWKIMTEGTNGESYHISTEHMISIRELVACLCQKLKVDFDEHVDIVGERLGKDASYQLDSKKVRTALQWHDRISLDQGLDECIEWVEQYFDELKNQSFDYMHKP